MRIFNQIRDIVKIIPFKKSFVVVNCFRLHTLHTSKSLTFKKLQNQQLNNFSTKLKNNDQQTFKLIIKRLKVLAQRFEQIQKILIDIALEEKNVSSEGLRKQLNRLQPIINIYEKIIATQSNIKDLNQMEAQVSQASEKQLIKQQIAQLNTKLEELRDESLQALIQPDMYDDCSQINCEFRSGAGGTQSAIFVQDVSNMYINYCRSQGWKVSVVSGVRQNVLHKGYKNLVLRIIGQESYKIMKCEAGVHKVIRVPQTQSKGRLHSSTISVAIMPNVPFDFIVNEKDIKYEFMKSSGPGGQSVNKTESACRAIHLPTGLSVMIQQDRSQDRNKKRATQILKQKLFEIEWKKNIESQARARKSQVGTMDRSEKIRTYNYPQDRITDHRTGLTLFGMEQMLNGSFLQQFIHAYQNKIYQQKLQVLLQALQTQSN